MAGNELCVSGYCYPPYKNGWFRPSLALCQDWTPLLDVWPIFSLMGGIN